MRNNQRRSLRIPLSVPLIVSNLRPQGFSECCETVAASGHGCQLRSSRPMETGMQVRLDPLYTNRATNATVIHSEPVGHERGTIVWNCGLALDKPGNFWNIPSPPQDWPSVNGFGKKDVALSVSPPIERLAVNGRRTSASDPELLQMLGAIETRIAGLETRVGNVAAKFETDALTQLQQSFGEMIGQARERIKRYSVACGESRLVGLEAELEQRIAPVLTRSQTAISDLERLLESLRQEHDAWNTRMVKWQQYGEQLQSWLAQETQQFHSLAHDAMVEAGGQVKGRLQAAIETACEPMERRLRDMESQQAETERSFRVRLAAQQAEALDLFQQQAQDVMGRAISRMHATLNDALESAARALRD